MKKLGVWFFASVFIFCFYTSIAQATETYYLAKTWICPSSYGPPAGGGTHGLPIQPKGIAFNTIDENIYVVAGSNKVLKCWIGGDELTQWRGFSEGDVARERAYGPDCLNQPRGIAINQAGNIYIADSMNGRIVQYAYDRPSERLRTITDHLHIVNGVCIASADGTIYALDADGGANHVVHFNSDGSFANEWSTASSEYTSLRGVAFSLTTYVSPNNALYVSDSTNNRITKFDPTGGHPQSSSVRLNVPTGIAIDNHANVYVADKGSNRVLKLDPSMSTILAEIGGFSGPEGVAVTPSGNDIFVADTGNGRIQKFTNTPAPTTTNSGPIFIQSNVTTTTNRTILMQSPITTTTILHNPIMRTPR